MNIAYVRVSTKEQNTARQLEALEKYNIERTFEEKVSAKDTNRPELQSMLDYVRENDIVYVESFSRLARNTLDLLTIVKQISEKNAGLVSLKEQIDTTSPAGRLQLGVFAAIYQFERECSKERQREGIEIALRTGQTRTGNKYGRPKEFHIDNNFKLVYDRWKSGEITGVQAIKEVQMKKATFYKRVQEYESQLATLKST